MKNTLIVNFAKSDLRTGMVVECANGVLRLIWSNNAVSMNNGGVPLSMIRADFTCGDKEDNDIIKVYSEPHGNLQADFDFWLINKQVLPYCKLLWKRKEEKTILTLDGIDYSETTLRSLIKKAYQSDIP